MPGKAETITHIELSKLVPFQDHPFAVREDEAMAHTSIMFGQIFSELSALSVSACASASIIKNSTGVKDARTTIVTKFFEPCDDLYQYKGTVYHHVHFSQMFKLGHKFIELDTNTRAVFYIWGYAYDFDIFPKRWKKMEEYCNMMSGRADIFYGTNLEVLCNE